MSLNRLMIFFLTQKIPPGPSIRTVFNIQTIDKLAERFRITIVESLLELCGRSFPLVETIIAFIVNDSSIRSSWSEAKWRRRNCWLLRWWPSSCSSYIYTNDYAPSLVLKIDHILWIMCRRHCLD